MRAASKQFLVDLLSAPGPSGDDGPVRARLIQDPSQSPDGRRLAFSALTHLYLMETPKGTPYRVNSGDDREFHPAWSPDGQWLAYVTWSTDGGHLWKVRADGQGSPRRLTQAPGYNDPFHGPISKMGYRKGRYLPRKKLNLPLIHGTEFILYGLTLTDIKGDGKEEIVMLDKESHLRVYSAQGRTLVKSNEYYGRNPRIIEVGVKEDIQGVAQEGEPVQYRGRLSFIRQGTSRYLLIPKIDSAAGSLLPGVVVDPNSSMVFLSITREGFEKLFEMRKQKGYIAGHGIMKAQKNTPRSLHMATVEKKSSFNKKHISTIYTYSWEK